MAQLGRRAKRLRILADIGHAAGRRVRHPLSLPREARRPGAAGAASPSPCRMCSASSRGPTRSAPASGSRIRRSWPTSFSGPRRRAGCAPLVKKLMAEEAPLVRENTLAALFFTDQDKAAAEMGESLAYGRDVATATSNELILACLVNEKYGLGHLPGLRHCWRPTISLWPSQRRMHSSRWASRTTSPCWRPRSISRSASCWPRNRRCRGSLRWGGRCWRRFPKPCSCTALAAESVESHVDPRDSEGEHRSEPLHPLDGNTVFNAVGLLRRWPRKAPRNSGASRLARLWPRWWKPAAVRS